MVIEFLYWYYRVSEFSGVLEGYLTVVVRSDRDGEMDLVGGDSCFEEIIALMRC